LPTTAPDTELHLSIADTIWLATALLHRENPKARGFDHRTILRKVTELDPFLNSRSVSTHLSTHCIASKAANPATLRTLTETSEGLLRLYHDGDPCHPTRRSGRALPKPNTLPDRYRDLLSSYADSRPAQNIVPAEEDPILGISGVGKEMWSKLGGGESFIRDLREEIFPANMTSTGFDLVWERIMSCQGHEFRTVTRKPFSYNFRNNAVVPRPGKGEETNQYLSKSEFEKAWDRRPLSDLSQIRDLRGHSYIYAILVDPRISKS
jgi:hypothetical protein